MVEIIKTGNEKYPFYYFDNKFYEKEKRNKIKMKKERGNNAQRQRYR